MSKLQGSSLLSVWEQAITDGNTALAALIITYNNIINLTIQSGQIPCAMEYFHQAKTAIVQLLQDKSLDNKMQNITERHLYRFLSGSVQLFGADEKIETLLYLNPNCSKKTTNSLILNK